MTEPADRTPGDADEERVGSRAELLPEERSAGSEDPVGQAREILEESDARTADPEGTGTESVQTADPETRGDDGGH
jgi:hypothetical protein